MRLAYVASVLREAGATVGFLDCVLRCYDEKAGAGAVFEFHPDVIYAVIDPAFAEAQISFLEKLKEWGAIRIVLGGPWAATHWESVLERTAAAEAVIVGEVEEALLEVITLWQEGRSVVRLAGVATLVGKKAVSGERRPPILDLSLIHI